MLGLVEDFMLFCEFYKKGFYIFVVFNFFICDVFMRDEVVIIVFEFEVMLVFWLYIVDNFICFEVLNGDIEGGVVECLCWKILRVCFSLVFVLFRKVFLFLMFILGLVLVSCVEFLIKGEMMRKFFLVMIERLESWCRILIVLCIIWIELRV